ncbi:NAD-dependent 4,6-dehydratase LegB [Bacteroidota bacterium]
MQLEGKKVLITGADGFIGSHLVEMIVKKGAKVRALSYYNSFNYLGWLENLDCLSEIEIVSGDVRDPNYCREITKDIDVIFHLAALITIPYSYIAPDSYIDTNIKGTINICQAALANNCERIIHTSTSEVYGTALYVPIDEKHPKQAQSPYSASKIGADALAKSFYNSFDLPLTIARPFNAYGPRQSARAIIPTIITQILHGSKKIKLGDLSPTRDLNFVKDLCRGFVLLAEHDDTIGKEINISSNSEISMKDIFEKIKEILCADVELISDKQRLRPSKSEVFRLWGDNSLINELTGYKPEYNIDKGLIETIEWYKNQDNTKMYKSDKYNV